VLLWRTHSFRGADCRILEGWSCSFSRAGCARSRRSLSVPLCRAPTHPALRGRPSPRPPSWKAFLGELLLLGKVARASGGGVGVCPFLRGRSQTREDRVNNVLKNTSEKAANVALLGSCGFLPHRGGRHVFLTQNGDTPPTRFWGRPESSRTRPLPFRTTNLGNPAPPRLV
jgi:hypothetical protein